MNPSHSTHVLDDEGEDIEIDHQVYCRKCDQPIPEGEKWCSECREAMAEDAAEAMAQWRRDERRRR